MRCFHLPSFNRNDWPSARGSTLAEIFIRTHYTPRVEGRGAWPATRDSCVGRILFVLASVA
jgi:hypothetical protein